VRLSRTWAERNGSSEKSESSQRSQCLAELTVIVGQGQPRAQVCGEAGADLVEACSLAARLRRGDRQERGDAQRPEVEALEDHGACADRTGRGEAQRRDGVGELGCSVGRVGVGRLELARELKDEEAVDVSAELVRQQAAGLGPELRDLARHDRAQRDAAAKICILAG